MTTTTFTVGGHYLSTTRSAPRKRALRIATALAVVANVAFSYLHPRLGVGEGGNIGDISARYPSLFTPAGYAFAIWGVIYAAFLVYALAQLRPPAPARALADRLALPMLALNLLGMAWIAAFQAEAIAASLLVIAAMWLCALVTMRRASAALAAGEVSERWRVPFALIFGWLTVALLANAYTALVAAGSSWPLQPAFAVLGLVVALFAALGFGRHFGDAASPLVIGWASVAIAVANQERAPLVAGVATAVAVFSVGRALLTLVQTRRLLPRHAPRVLLFF